MRGAKMSYPASSGGQVTLSNMQAVAQRRRAAAEMAAAMMKGDVEAVLAALRPLSALADASSGVGEPNWRTKALDQLAVRVRQENPVGSPESGEVEVYSNVKGELFDSSLECG